MNKTQLAVLLKDYPFIKGEPYFHRELQTLSERFNQIILFVNHKPVSDAEQHFSTPENVEVINFASEQSPSQLGRLISDYSIDEIVKRTNGSIEKIQAVHYYLKESEMLQRSILHHLDASGLNAKRITWYSYWSDELAFVLARLKHSGIIDNAISRTHNHDIYESRHPNNYLPYRDFIFKHLNKVLCISNHGKLHLENGHPKRKGTFYCERLGVDSQPPITAEITDETIRIVSLSGILPVKQLDFMIDTFSTWGGKKIHWHHIGSVVDKNYAKKVERMANELLSKKENIEYTFHGYVKLEHVLESLRALNPHFLLNASTFEGIPVSMMEACSLGIPIIGPDVCGVPEIIEHRKNGYLFSPTSPEELLSIFHEIENLEESEYQDLRVNALNMQRQRFNAETNYNRLAAILKGETKVG